MYETKSIFTTLFFMRPIEVLSLHSYSLPLVRVPIFSVCTIRACVCVFVYIFEVVSFYCSYGHCGTMFKCMQFKFSNSWRTNDTWEREKKSIYCQAATQFWYLFMVEVCEFEHTLKILTGFPYILIASPYSPYASGLTIIIMSPELSQQYILNISCASIANKMNISNE